MTPPIRTPEKWARRGRNGHNFWSNDVLGQQAPCLVQNPKGSRHPGGAPRLDMAGGICGGGGGRERAIWYYYLNLNKVIKGDHILGVKDVIFKKDWLCSAYQARKQVGGSHPAKNKMTTSRPLQMLHMDLFGPNHCKSLGGSSFDLVIVGDYLRFTWVFFLHDKALVQRIFKTFTKKAQNQEDSKW